MRGVILGAGKGTRLYPLTHATNKLLLPVYDKPMIYYPIQTLVEAGVTDVLCIVGGPFAGNFFSLLGDGSGLGLTSLQYAYQETQRGPGDALLLAEQFAQGEPIVLILGDQVTDGSIRESVTNFTGGATILLHEFADPEGMGVPEFDPADPSKIIAIEENPTHPKTKYAATGIYIYDSKCFAYAREFQGTVEGEIKPTHINNKYIEAGELSWKHLGGYWADTGKFDRLLEASNYFAEKVA